MPNSGQPFHPGDQGSVDLAVRNDTLADLTALDQSNSPKAVHSSGAMAIAGLHSIFFPSPSRTLVPINVDVDGIVQISGTVAAAITGVTGSVFPIINGGQFANDTFVAAGDGTELNPDTGGNYFIYYAMQVEPVGAVSLWDVRLEITMTGVTWFEVGKLTQADGAGAIKVAAPAGIPTGHVRTRCASITLGPGTNINVILGARP